MLVALGPSQALLGGSWGGIDSENRGTVLGGPFKGILLYLGQKRGTPILGNTHEWATRVTSGYSLVWGTSNHACTYSSTSK